MITYGKMKKSVFREEEHPRDAGGKFTNKGAGANGTERENRRKSEKSKGATNQGARSRGQKPTGDRGNPDSVRNLSTKSFGTPEGYTYYHIEGEHAPKLFHGAIKDAKEGNSRGAFVHAYEPDEYKGSKLFVSEGKEAGFAVKPDGDIVSVFNNPKIGTKRGVAGAMLEVAIAHGGTKLDCFDGFLPKVYSKYGFVPIARLKFNREYAPEGWNYERDGEPDVMLFAHNGDSLDEVREKDYPLPNTEDVPLVDDWDTADAMRNEYMQKLHDPIVKSLSEVYNLMTKW